MPRGAACRTFCTSISTSSRSSIHTYLGFCASGAHPGWSGLQRPSDGHIVWPTSSKASGSCRPGATFRSRRHDRRGYRAAGLGTHCDLSRWIHASGHQRTVSSSSRTETGTLIFIDFERAFFFEGLSRACQCRCVTRNSAKSMLTLPQTCRLPPASWNLRKLPGGAIYAPVFVGQGIWWGAICNLYVGV